MLEQDSVEFDQSDLMFYSQAESLQLRELQKSPFGLTATGAERDVQLQCWSIMKDAPGCTKVPQHQR